MSSGRVRWSVDHSRTNVPITTRWAIVSRLVLTRNADREYNSHVQMHPRTNVIQNAPDVGMRTSSRTSAVQDGLSLRYSILAVKKVSRHNELTIRNRTTCYARLFKHTAANGSR